MELNLTQEELAERVGEGVRQSEISRLERNRVTLPRRQRMEEIAEALDIPIGLLLARSGWAGAETIEAEAGPPEPVHTDLHEEPGEREQTASGRTTERERELQSEPDNDQQHDRSLTVDPADSPELYEAIMRAEALIGESRSIYTEAQTTILQARESVKRRHITET